MARLWIPLGAINACLAVACGAFAAHGLKGRLSEYALGVFQTAAHYHLIHALALVAYGLWARSVHGNPSALPGAFFLVGILLFSGSLYALALTDVRALGMITPLGGLSFMAAWVLFALHAWRAN